MVGARLGSQPLPLAEGRFHKWWGVINVQKWDWSLARCPLSTRLVSSLNWDCKWAKILTNCHVVLGCYNRQGRARLKRPFMVVHGWKTIGVRRAIACGFVKYISLVRFLMYLG